MYLKVFEFNPFGKSKLPFIGKISYSIYLIHWLLILFVMNTWDVWGKIFGFGIFKMSIMLALYLGITISLTSLMYRFIEMPFIHFSKKWKYKR